MLRQVIAPASFFTQVSNEIIRHPRLSSDAVRLLTWQLSLPQGADQPLSKTAERAGIKRAGFMCAKRELTAEGFLHEWRLQNAAGRWSTTQLMSSVPLSVDDAALVRDGGPAGGVPAAGGPGSRSTGRSQQNTKDNTTNPPTPPSTPPSSPGKQADAAAAAQREEEPLPKVAAAPQTPAPPLPTPLVERGALALAAISHSERQLQLSGHDIAALAPIAGQWFHRGADITDLRTALTSGLRPSVHSPACLTHNRLTRKMSDPPTYPQQHADGRRMAGPSPRLAGTRECQGTHVQTQLFRPVADEILCRQCRCETAGAGASPSRSAARRQQHYAARPRYEHHSTASRRRQHEQELTPAMTSAADPSCGCCWTRCSTRRAPSARRHELRPQPASLGGRSEGLHRTDRPPSSGGRGSS